MPALLSKLLVGSTLTVAALAGPALAPITNQQQLDAALAALKTQSASDPVAAAAAGQAILTAIRPAAAPTSPADLQAGLQKILNPNNPQDILTSGANILLNGFAGSDYVNLLEAYTIASNQYNINLRQPRRPIYPKADANDAPYSLSEYDLRRAIYIPNEFTYGKIQPVIMIPGTGSLGGPAFKPTYGKLFEQNKIADPVYLNIPGNLLNDAQVNSEYVAYAINYISGVSGGKNVSTISWSQGSLNGQWAFKYWPSTRKITSDAIRISPDLHGTELARLLCPGLPSPFCVPSVIQQLYDSKYVATLRANGGDSAYVPTTNIYSIFDEIVQPQIDPNASGSINDARGVGATNAQLQTVCTPVLPAGTIIGGGSHEGVLYNALGYALAIDALTHDGPGRLDRIDVRKECAKFATDGLSLADILATEALIPLAAGNILAYTPKVTQEPPIKAYAA